MYGTAERIALRLFAVLSLLPFDSNAESVQRDLYGNVPVGDYITGKFDPYKSGLFVSVSDQGIPTSGKKILLRRDATFALSRLYADFKKEHPGVRFWVQSGLRTFSDQKAIWENKWNGRTAVEGVRLDRALPDPRRRALKILEFSSMPGTSRHHWGTDFDVNVLTNAYYESGEGRIVLNWLEKNAARYGFCRPYTAGRRSGYLEERWHWSYRPVSAVFLAEWVRQFGMREPPGGFDGSEHAKTLSRTYVESVSADCR